jgi:hypothetical protein
VVSESTWRTELLAHLPWITRLPEPAKCDAYRWSSMSVKSAMALKLGNDPTTEKKYRCKRHAYWRFEGITSKVNDTLEIGFEVGKSGTYCYTHLVTEAFIPYRETWRYETWCRENVDLVERIKSGNEPRIITRRRNDAAYDLSDEA